MTTKPATFHHTGRLYLPDERDMDFTLDRLLPQPTGKPVGRVLRAAPVRYNQGQTPDCTAASTSTAESIRAANLDGPDVTFDWEQLYAWANAHDGLPQPHEGSTVRAAFQGMVAVGDEVTAATAERRPAPKVGTYEKATSYLWADLTDVSTAVDHLISWLEVVSAIVVGIPWYQSMFCQNPDTGTFTAPRGGYLPVVPDDSDEGHAICIRGVNADDPRCPFVMRNSWVPWGISVAPDFSLNLGATNGGDILVARADLETLLAAQGEAGALVSAQIQ